MNEEIKVTIVSHTPNPVAKVKAVTNMFGKREPKTDVEDIKKRFSQEVLNEHFRDLFKSDLKAPFEFINFTIRFDNVTRAFTHQLVRKRTGVYAHQSMRFINMEDFGYRNSCKTHSGHNLYRDTMGYLQGKYSQLIDAGEHPQDARGIIPTNVKNSIMMDMDYRNLLALAEHRLCRQAQGEWVPVMKQLKEEMRKINPVLAEGMKPGCEFTGICQFGADFDRTCGKWPTKAEAKKIIEENWERKNFDPDNDYID